MTTFKITRTGKRKVSMFGGRGEPQRNQTTNSSQTRRVFDKLVKDGDATMDTVHQARRFLEGIESFQSKAELLSRLEDRRYYGLRRIRDLLSFVNSTDDIKRLVVPLLKHFITDETARPMYVPLRNKVLMAIYMVPALMDTLVEHNVIELVDQGSAKYICKYLMAVSRAFIEARNSENVMKLARALRNRGDIDDARVLCAILLVDNIEEAKPAASNTVTNKSTVACWVTDEIPPGGRHDNDHLNYRDVQIVPTADELCCETRPWLPLGSGENAFIQDPAVRLIDKNFRLLREDAILTMKSNIREEGHPWRNARVVDLDITGRKKKGPVSFIIQCDSRPGGNINWERSRALTHGAVVAFCRDGVPKMMGVITVRDCETQNKWLNTPDGPVIGIAFGESDVKQALEDMQCNCANRERIDDLCARRAEAQKRRETAKTPQLDAQIDGYRNRLELYDMIEASSSFFTYQPILKSLQAMIDVPFPLELCGEDVEAKTLALEYLPATLSMPSGGDLKGYQCNLRAWSSRDIVSKTSLDFTQAEALRHTFTNRVALIQGPPGTGKTFIGALVARMIRSNTNESILCVCYTNHALDQFLEHLLDTGERKIVRIGGRSKSERLSGYQLRELAQHKSSNRSSEFRRIDAQWYQQRELIGKARDVIKKPVGWTSPYGGMCQFLQDDSPYIYECFVLDACEDGFMVVGPDSKPLSEDFLWNCWIKGEAFPDWLRAHLPTDMPIRFEELWALPHNARLAMSATWRRVIMQSEIEILNAEVDESNRLTQARQMVQQEQDLEILRDARVIGATTTGAAQFKDLLSSKAAGVVIIEEAGEVLEAHILSALHSEATKHLIMIGDHQQLRPKVESFQLTTVSGGGYQLDCSLFERLVLSKLPSVTLGVQHRMRPEISELIRNQTYPLLQDHPSVSSFPDIKGVTKNVVFIDHRVPEDGEIGDGKEDVRSLKTKSNNFEAELCIAVVRFFLLQGYSPDRIVVLTPYLGQLLKILHLVRSQLKEATAFVSEKDCRDLDDIGELSSLETAQQDSHGSKSVRCSSIDNFQGEEADIVVISLVRSNPRGDIGFMKEAQRVNVLMSRARHGMFFLGNSSTLRESRKGRHVWNPILDALQQQGHLLKGLPTYCQIHPADEAIVLSSIQDFRTFRPNGGCNRLCNFRMDCGHACNLNCHPFDRAHERVQKNCCEPCMRIPPECHVNHPCPKLCKDDCGPCTAKVGPIRLNCGHSRDLVPCHDTRNEEAIKTLSRTCRQIVSHKFSPCGHSMKTTCANANRAVPVCSGKCSRVIDKCGHKCVKECGQCDGGHLCSRVCERKMFCGHICGQSCHVGQDCPPCKNTCAVTCTHSSCPKRCNVPCASCIEKCDWICEHQGGCELVCGAPCSRLPCDRRCEKTLHCGHRCFSLCGETCPDSKYCRECSAPSVKSQVVDMIMLTTYEEHNLDVDPIIVLPCGHLYTVSSLDGHLAMKEVYKQDGSGSFVAVRPLREADINEKPKACPNCRAVIHSIRRYGRLLRLSELRSLERKHLMSVNQSLEMISRQTQERKKPLKGTKLVQRLEKVEKELLRSPMRKVYEACRNQNVFEVPMPPTRPLLHTLELLGRAYADMAETRNDHNFKLAKEVLDRGIALSDGTTSTRSGADLRLVLCSLLIKWPSPSDTVKTEAEGLVDWIIQLESSLPAELTSKAKELKEIIQNPYKEISEVLSAAMGGQRGYDYGTSWSAHWYECPNGHPYMIGDCGGATQESRCPECQAPIGGSGHRLNSTNRQAGGIVGEVLQGRR